MNTVPNKDFRSVGENNHEKFRFLMFVGLLLYAFQVGFADEIPSNETVRNKIISTFEQTSNIRVEYRRLEEFTPPLDVANEINKGVKGVIVVGSHVFESEFKFCDGQAFYKDARVTDGRGVVGFAEVREGEAIEEERSMAVGRSEIFARRFRSDALFGIIAKSISLPEEKVIDYALGLRCHRDAAFLDSDRIKKMEVDVRSKNNAVLTERLPDGRTNRWDYSVDASHAILNRYSLSDIDGRELVIVENTDFVDVSNSLRLPQKIIQRRMYFSGGVPHSACTTSISVSKYTLHYSSRDSEEFLIEWPIGTNVFDQRTQTKFVIKSKPLKLTDDLIVKNIDKARTAQDEAAEKILNDGKLKEQK